jgi:hypothetical protein
MSHATPLPGATGAECFVVECSSDNAQRSAFVSRHTILMFRVLENFVALLLVSLLSFFLERGPLSSRGGREKYIFLALISLNVEESEIVFRGG